LILKRLQILLYGVPVLRRSSIVLRFGCRHMMHAILDTLDARQNQTHGESALSNSRDI
jgi:hypothetical protein